MSEFQIGDLIEEIDSGLGAFGTPDLALVLSKPDFRGNQIRQDLYILNKRVLKLATIAIVYSGEPTLALWRKCDQDT